MKKLFTIVATTVLATIGLSNVSAKTELIRDTANLKRLQERQEVLAKEAENQLTEVKEKILPTLAAREHSRFNNQFADALAKLQRRIRQEYYDSAQGVKTYEEEIRAEHKDFEDDARRLTEIAVSELKSEFGLAEEKAKAEEGKALEKEEEAEVEEEEVLEKEAEEEEADVEEEALEKESEEEAEEPQEPTIPEIDEELTDEELTGEKALGAKPELPEALKVPKIFQPAPPKTQEPQIPIPSAEEEW